MQRQQFDPKAMSELILFFANESEGDRFFGAIKLNKLLFIADFMAYGYLGHSITGATYVHQERGPTPAPNQFLSVRDALVNAGELLIEEEETYNGTRKRPVALRKPDLSIFSEAEIELCRDVLASLEAMSGMTVSEWSHRFVGWQYTEQGQEIPYSTVYLWERPSATTEDFKRAHVVAQQLGLVGR